MSAKTAHPAKPAAKTGKKLMNKSEGSYIALSDSSVDMYGKTMALPDETIVQVFTDCTLLSISEIEQIKKRLEAGINPRDIKMNLAFELVVLYYGKSKAEKAQKKFIQTFQKKEFPNNAPEITVKQGVLLKDVMMKENIVSSHSDLRRLIGAGAVKDVAHDIKIHALDFKIINNMDIKIGKRKFLKIKVKE